MLYGQGHSSGGIQFLSHIVEICEGVNRLIGNRISSSLRDWSNLKFFVFFIPRPVEMQQQQNGHCCIIEWIFIISRILLLNFRLTRVHHKNRKKKNYCYKLTWGFVFLTFHRVIKYRKGDEKRNEKNKIKFFCENALEANERAHTKHV